MAKTYLSSAGWTSLDEMLTEHHDWTGWKPPITRAYLLQIREKQKARRMYGVLERQFHNY